MNIMRHILLVLLLILFAGAAGAQRRVTPVGAPEPGTSFRSLTDSIARRNLVEQTDAQGRILLVDTVTGTEFVDSSAMIRTTKMFYPLITNLVAGVNIWDGGMRALGQKYGLGSVWAWLPLHNRYMPYVEAGLGMADDTPDGSNFTFRSPLSPFFKVGINYNFLYNSSTDYQIYAGLRYGFSPFRYSVDNITVDEGYWNDPSHFSIPSRSCMAGWIEFVIGIKVKIVRRLSMGWTVGYHAVLHESNSPYGEPMIIPGFGKRGNAITASLSLIYTFTLNKKGLASVNTSEQTN